MVGKRASSFYVPQVRAEQKSKKFRKKQALSVVLRMSKYRYRL